MLVTSNKRDVVDATRGPRSARGEVWPFDPQGIVGAPADWWWNPLTYVTDEVKADDPRRRLRGGQPRPVGARTDAYFEPAGQRLLANLLLAAALAERPLTQVYLWLSDPTDDEPVDGPRGARLPAARRGAAVGRQRAREAARRRLRHRAADRVVHDQPRGDALGHRRRRAAHAARRSSRTRGSRPTADARAGASSTRTSSSSTSGTLYSLSKEGRGSAGPLVTALTVAICEAAEERAKRSPGGRLPVPLVAVLDEAANVCRWRELPNLYSHYGSRGICMMTILQSWSQGVEVWGRDGMRKLWSAANVKVYGGGVSEVEFLSELSQLDRRLRPQHDVGLARPRRPLDEPRGAPRARPRRRRSQRHAQGPRRRLRVRRAGRRSCARCRGWPARTPPPCARRSPSTTRPPRSRSPRRWTR